ARAYSMGQLPAGVGAAAITGEGTRASRTSRSERVGRKDRVVKNERLRLAAVIHQGVPVPPEVGPLREWPGWPILVGPTHRLGQLGTSVFHPPEPRQYDRRQEVVQHRSRPAPAIRLIERLQRVLVSSRANTGTGQGVMCPGVLWEFSTHFLGLGDYR